MKKIFEKRNVGIFISIICFLIFLINIGFYEFNILNLIAVIFSIYFLLILKKNVDDFLKLNVYLFIATSTLMFSFYAYCFGDIPSKIYCEVLLVYLFFSIVFKLEHSTILTIIILVFICFISNELQNYISLYAYYAMLVASSYKKIKVFKLL